MKKIKFKKNIFYKIISILLAISSICFLGLLTYMNLLPSKYLTIIYLVVVFFVVINVFFVNLKRLKKKIKKVISIFMVLGIIIMTCGSFYLGKTLDVLLNNGDSKHKLCHYSVMVLKNSSYNKIGDIKGEKVGYFKNSIGAKDANDSLKKEIKVSFSGYNASDSLANDLLNSKINIIVVEDSIKNIMFEEIEGFEKNTKVIHTFTIRTKVETTLKDVNVTIEPFAVYISGIDTYGQISSVSRSDVNMVMVVNPETHQILLISIPRDYYVQLHDTVGNKDKLTHAGIYGIDMSIQTIEDLLELDINYYLKVNFTSVIDIVDALGGLEVYSEYTFTSYSGYRFKKGKNTVNGEQALDFARTRKAFKEGDRQRGKNQQALIAAVIEKATDKSIITKYNSLLDAINGKYQTNMSIKSLTSLVKMQLKDMAKWNIHSYSLTGSDAKDYTYTYNQLLYVMKPDESSVLEAIELIDLTLKGESLVNSYTDLGGISNKVTQVPVTSPKNQNTQNDKQSEIEEEQVESPPETDETIDELEPILPEYPEEEPEEEPEEIIENSGSNETEPSTDINQENNETSDKTIDSVVILVPES